MSGKKRILVDESEWFKLQRQASRLSELKRDVPRLIADVRKQVDADLLRVSDGLDRRQRATERVVSGLSEQTRQLEAETSQRLSEQERRLEHQLRTTAGELRRETDAALAEQERAWRSELSEERRRRREQMERVTSRIADLEEDRDRAVQAARTLIADARALRDLVAETLPHERFALGKLDRLTRDVDVAENNLEGGYPEAALSSAQTAVLALSDLRLELELHDREWRLARSDATEALTTVRGLIEQNAVRPILDERGEPLEDVTLDVDHWSSGELATLREEADATLKRMNSADELSLDELRAISQRDAPALERRLSDLVARAGLRQLASQLRVNLADAVIETLEATAGYGFSDGAYVGADEREAFLAKVVHNDGSSIVIDVSPADEDGGRCTLRLLSYDRTAGDDEVRLSRAREIAYELRNRGLQVEDPEAEDGEPDPALEDLDAVRRAEPQALEARS